MASQPAEERPASALHASALVETTMHDLMAPLRAVQGLAEALLEDHASRLDPVGQDYARRIVRAARHMERLVEVMRQCGRLEQEAPAPVSLPTVSLPTVSLPTVSLRHALAQALADVVPDCEAELAALEPLPLVRSHGVLLWRVLALLLDSVPPAAPGRAPRLEVEQRAGRVRLWIGERGAGERGGETGGEAGGMERGLLAQAVARLGGVCGRAADPSRGIWIELPLAG